MSETPPIRYARSGGFHIAYQDHGEGPSEMIVFKPAENHLELQWTEPRVAAFLRRLATFGRIIDFDTRGTGLSDRLEPGCHPSFEVWADDALAVLDEAAVERVDAAVAFADKSPFPAPESLYDHIYVFGDQVQGWYSVDERSAGVHRGEDERSIAEAERGPEDAYHQAVEAAGKEDVKPADDAQDDEDEE